jgi:hypothetical protein
MLEVLEPVEKPELVVHLKKPMVPRAVEVDRSAVCHGSWGWGAILEVVAQV